jgi:hypothetical protein
MNTDHRLHMANRSGEFFQAMPDQAKALNGVAPHASASGRRACAAHWRRMLTNTAATG